MISGGHHTERDFTDRILAWYGAYFISFVGLLHLLLSGEHFGYALYLGILFLANFVAAVVTALAILWTESRWAWLMGTTVAGGAMAVFLASRVFGLPGFPEAEDQWFNFGGWISLGFELAFLAAVPLALTRRGKRLLALERARVDREKLPPDRQKTSEHFNLIEEEMREVRSRMAGDVEDLRAHLKPQGLGDRVKRSWRARLRDLLQGKGGYRS